MELNVFVLDEVSCLELSENKLQEIVSNLVNSNYKIYATGSDTFVYRIEQMIQLARE